ncbi:MAG: glycosyltransferase [Saprospiraceae bacterium]|nr:glycosyltransferase [Saprospiraceae bacterium]
MILPLSKIIIIGPAYPLRGGLATFDERLARQCIAEGHDVKIYTFSLQYPNFLFPGKTQYSESAPPEDLSIRVCINSINPLNWWKVAKALDKEQADVILVRYWLPFMGPCLGSILRWMKKSKTLKIALVDNAIPHEKRMGDGVFTRYFIGAIDRFVVMSHKVKTDLMSFGVKEILVKEHPLYDNFGQAEDASEARRKLSLPEDVKIFLFFGFIRHYKGLDLLIDALQYLEEWNGKYALVIAGEFYAGEDDIKTKIQNSPVRDHIILHTHFIKDEDVKWYFSAADWVIQPYRHATQSGVTPLAYHFEKPMIVTNVGNLPSMVPNGIGIVVQPDPVSLAEGMKESFSFDFTSFRKAIGPEKKKYSWETFTKDLFS